MTARPLLILCCLCAALLSVLACSGADESTAEEAPAVPAVPASDGTPEPSTAPAAETATVNPVNATAEQVATGFLEAYGAFDAERAITYLADDADISRLISSVGGGSLDGGLEGFRLLLSLLEAESYKQILHGCRETGSSDFGTHLHCTYDFHKIRSDERGLGPFGGSFFLLAVRDGKIVQASNQYATGEYSPQVWEPFADWVSTNYPEDAAVMYTGGTSGARLTEQSIQLWDQHTREYAEEVGLGTGGSETSP